MKCADFCKEVFWSWRFQRFEISWRKKKMKLFSNVVEFFYRFVNLLKRRIQGLEFQDWVKIGKFIKIGIHQKLKIKILGKDQSLVVVASYKQVLTRSKEEDRLDCDSYLLLIWIVVTRTEPKIILMEEITLRWFTVED